MAFVLYETGRFARAKRAAWTEYWNMMVDPALRSQVVLVEFPGGTVLTKWAKDVFDTFEEMEQAARGAPLVEIEHSQFAGAR